MEPADYKAMPTVAEDRWAVTLKFPPLSIGFAFTRSDGEWDISTVSDLGSGSMKML